jgi:hypothetical protein
VDDDFTGIIERVENLSEKAGCVGLGYGKRE